MTEDIEYNEDSIKNLKMEAQYEIYEADHLAPAKGIALGIILGSLFWLCFGLAVFIYILLGG